MASDNQILNSTSTRFRNFCQTNINHPGPAPRVPISDVGDLYIPSSPTAAPALTETISLSTDTSSNIGGLFRARTSTGNSTSSGDGSPKSESAARMMMKCCCGQPDCAFLEHNDLALGGLERDLETAARLGQALLDRHEAYVKESQAENARLGKYIAELEQDKVVLQETNSKFVTENRDLLSKLEALNDDLGGSSARIFDLEQTLKNCESEIRRLNVLSRNAQELEMKVLELEEDRVQMMRDIDDSRDETRSTILRWKDSERRVRELEREVQKLELQARLDYDRHGEVIARLQNDRLLDRELSLSEGRLKATAAMQNVSGGGQKDKAVVGNFVRDILQDNANLQAGIAELRELLQSSNEEVQNLRDRVIQHQPLLDDTLVAHSPQPSLGEELSYGQSPKQVQQELHVHHHYQVTPAKKIKTVTRRPKRNRGLLPGSTSSSASSVISGYSNTMRPLRQVSNPTMPLSEKSKNAQINRWSMQSSATASTYMSSISSSPSHFTKNGSIFDDPEDEELSRPTSPDLATIPSPLPWKRRGTNERLLAVFDENEEDISPGAFPSASASDLGNLQELSNGGQAAHIELIPELTPKPSMLLDTHTKPPIAETPPTVRKAPVPEPPPPPEVQPEREVPAEFDKAQQDLDKADQPDNQLEKPDSNHDQSPPKNMATKKSAPDTLGDLDQPLQPHSFSAYVAPRPLRRSASHESVLSISGMDVHISQPPSRPNNNNALNLLRGSNKYHFSGNPTLSTTAKLTSTTQPIAEISGVAATRKTTTERGAGALALSGAIMQDHPSMRTETVRAGSGKGLMGSVGGWMSKKWGVAPVKSVVDPRGAAAARQPTGPTTAKSGLRSVSAASSVLSADSDRRNTSSKGKDKQIDKPHTSTGDDLSSKTRADPDPENEPESASSSDSDAVIHRIDLPQTPSTSTPARDTAPPSTFRAPGINQPGSIAGFAAMVAAAKQAEREGERTSSVNVDVQPHMLDLKGLQESLAE